MVSQAVSKLGKIPKPLIVITTAAIFKRQHAIIIILCAFVLIKMCGNVPSV